MKIATLIARNLLGLIFVVFGLNGFHRFLPTPPSPSGTAAQFMGALFTSNYMVPVFALQLIGGALLLANRYVPIGLVLLGPVIVNIVLFHLLMAPAGLPMAAVVSILFLITFAGFRGAFAGIFAATPSEVVGDPN